MSFVYFIVIYLVVYCFVNKIYAETHYIHNTIRLIIVYYYP